MNKRTGSWKHHELRDESVNWHVGLVCAKFEVSVFFPSVFIE